nr:LysR substrate-binding domain-containing protein [uncultured Dongia sp.]
MKQFSLDLLDTFVCIIDAGGFARAEAALARSQPAISLQLRRLEDQFGQELLLRHKGPIKLTKAGECLLPYARRILRLRDEATRELASAQSVQSVRVGIPSDFAQSLLPRALARFSDSQPNVALEIRCELSADLLAGLDGGALDLVIAMTSDRPDARASQIWQEEMVWVGAANARKKPFQREVLPVIAHPESCIYRKRMSERLSAAGRVFRFIMTTESHIGLVAAVKAGLGVTAVARSTVPPELVILESADLPELGSVSMAVYRHADGQGDAVNKLTDLLVAQLMTARDRVPATDG